MIDGGITQPRDYSTVGSELTPQDPITAISPNFLLFSYSVSESPTDSAHQLKTTIVDYELSQLVVNYAVNHNPIQVASSSSSSSFTPISTSLPVTGSTKTVSSGTIVGIVLGVVILILLAVAALFFRKRARNKARSLARCEFLLDTTHL